AKVFAPIGTPNVLPPDCPAANKFGKNADVSIFVSSVDANTPASANVETTGLSTINTSGEAPCCAAKSALFVKSVVSYPVRLIVTPALVPHWVSNFVQAEVASNC